MSSKLPAAKTRISVQNFIQEHINGSKNSAYKQFPKLITLDAYNTIYATKKPVLNIYAETYNLNCAGGKKMAINSEQRDTMYSKFSEVFKNHCEKYPNYGKYTPISATEWWIILVKEIFTCIDIKLNTSETLKILEPFKGTVYSSFPDLSELLMSIKKNSKSKIGICSNTDPTFHSILSHLKECDSNFVLPDEKFVYLSYNLDLKKNRSGDFFKSVLAKAQHEIPHLKPADCLHIGDEIVNDLVGSAAAGWNSVCIDREDSYGFFSRQNGDNSVTNERITLNKINKNMDLAYQEGRDCRNVVMLENGGLVVRNLVVLKEILLAIKAEEEK